MVLNSSDSNRRLTRTVQVGNVGIGSSEPIRIQSMLTCETTDITDVIREIRALDSAKCELVRITIPNRKALDVVPEIRRRMMDLGIQRPLIADIHFNPQLAVDACEHFEKVRINPGNYADRKKFEIREYSDSQYAEELVRIEEALFPLIQSLKTNFCSLRVGTNHGSLSDRIMNRYGDTPEGMVQSALEFLRILERHQYYDTILSMKSSNPLVMKEAYRLLVDRMNSEGMEYPLHLGVTEAGSGTEGRIKSAVGIGGLLCEGLGDTIRVSLTEPAENEIPVARAILCGVDALLNHKFTKAENEQELYQNQEEPSLPLTGGQILASKSRRAEWASSTTDEPPVVELDDCRIGPGESFKLLALVHDKNHTEKLAEFDALIDADFDKDPIKWIDEQDLCSEYPENRLLLLKAAFPLVACRELSLSLLKYGKFKPVGYVLPPIDSVEASLGLAAELGELITSGELHCLISPNNLPESKETEFARILMQATRVRLFRADFISCPSCGRTFFDLQQTTEAIKKRTAHLKGVKIAVMGCVVNGPGEMADADYGYIGAGPDMVHLYRGQQCVERNIPSVEAVERLITLIRDERKWVDPEGP